MVLGNEPHKTRIELEPLAKRLYRTPPISSHANMALETFVVLIGFRPSKSDHKSAEVLVPSAINPIVHLTHARHKDHLAPMNPRPKMFRTATALKNRQIPRRSFNHRIEPQARLQVAQPIAHFGRNRMFAHRGTLLTFDREVRLPRSR